MFRVGDLREHIYSNWTKVVSGREHHGSESLENITEKPGSVERIQLLHLGQRLDPNRFVTDLNITLSHVIHIVVKPNDLRTEPVPEKKRFDRFASQIMKAKGQGKRRGSTSNIPVPAFVTSAAGSSSAAMSHNNGSLQSTNHAKRSMETSYHRKSSEETQTATDGTGDANRTCLIEETAVGTTCESQDRSQPTTPICEDSPPSLSTPSVLQAKEGSGCCIIM
ncbi:DEKNAAC103372 [Brettanomyces naardenensis]|uniref:DEKNAAC103372 n=1 Tax=Brettanomyces naardenensis TaxID=13370 RepID=A0A448YNL0_BRENA|nr:DEKNAAC103372 [Brettanomyces naardenensis]